MGSGPFNAHSRGGGGGGLVQYVFRSPARNPARQSSRRGSCAAPLSEKRSSLCSTAHKTDAATGEPGDLLDLITRNPDLDCLGEGMDAARSFPPLPRPPKATRFIAPKRREGRAPEAACR